MPSHGRTYRGNGVDACSSSWRGFSDIDVDDGGLDISHDSFFDKWRGDGQTSAEKSEEG
jgi:hypothetical protein